ncbi:MAG: GlcNAc-PI de-N-acetylase [Acidimicrobiia bacterium]|nr:GlcNAc-PI de-N-acetylase [Acidimicrobiia bacterium]
MATLVSFHAHPDDEAIATGGVMARAAEDGHRVVLVVATRGEQGEPVPGVLGPDEPLWTRRVEETQRSAGILGAERVEFLGYVDSGMIGEPTNDDPSCFWQADVEDAAGRLAAILREVDADVITIYDDHGGYGHPDHIQVHRVGLRAAELVGLAPERVFASTMNRDVIERARAEAPAMDGAGGGPGDMEEEDWDTSEFGSPEAEITHAVDVRAVLDRKRAAMEAHESQISPDSFFFAMPPEAFASLFGVEWYTWLGPRRVEGAPFLTDLLPSSEPGPT